MKKMSEFPKSLIDSRFRAAFTRLSRRGGVPARAARVGCRLLDQPFYGWGRCWVNKISPRGLLP